MSILIKCDEVYCSNTVTDRSLDRKKIRKGIESLTQTLIF